MSETRPRVVVVGCGAWGRNLVRNFAELGALGGVVDRNGDRARAVAAQHGSRALPLAAALEDPAIDGLCIATLPVTHHAFGMQALAAGKHLLVEKPLTLCRRDAVALIEAAAARGRVLMAGHILRYHPAFVALERLVAEGAFGALRRLHSSRLNLGAIRRHEDALWCLAPHDVSMILALARARPASVTGFGERVLDRAPYDAAAFRLGFACGLTAMVQVSWLHPVKEHRLSVIGSEAMAVFDDTRPWSEKLTLYRHAVGEDLAIASADPEPVPLAPGEPLKEECRAFLRAITTGEPPPSDGAEALRVVEVLARVQSALSDHEPAQAS